MAIPRTRMPMQYARQYFREIRRLLKNDRRRVWQAFQEEIRPRIHQYRRQVQGPNLGIVFNRARFTINDALEDIQHILERLRDTAENQIFAVPVVERIVWQFVNQVNRYTRSNFRQQVMRVLGFDPTANEPWLDALLKTAVQENVSYIKTIATEYHNKIETIILQGVRRGRSINDMAKEISEAGDVSIRRARFIARDQIGSIHGDLVKRRQTALGLRRFRWRTSRDERVRGNPSGLYPDARPSHYDLDGKIFTWRDGAEVGGRRIWPGTDYNCRCTAEPLEEELLEVAEKEEELLEVAENG